jgi:hypothetical protein
MLMILMKKFMPIFHQRPTYKTPSKIVSTAMPRSLYLSLQVSVAAAARYIYLFGRHLLNL